MIIVIFFYRSLQSNKVVNIEVNFAFIINLLNDKKTIVDSGSISLINSSWIESGDDYK